MVATIRLCLGGGLRALERGGTEEGDKADGDGPPRSGPARGGLGASGTYGFTDADGWQVYVGRAANMRERLTVQFIAVPDREVQNPPITSEPDHL